MCKKLTKKAGNPKYSLKFFLCDHVTDTEFRCVRLPENVAYLYKFVSFTNSWVSRIIFYNFATSTYSHNYVVYFPISEINTIMFRIFMLLIWSCDTVRRNQVPVCDKTLDVVKIKLYVQYKCQQINARITIKRVVIQPWPDSSGVTRLFTLMTST